MAAVSTGVTIRTLHMPRDLVAVNTLFQRVWGSNESIANVDLLRAVAHAGGYVAGGYDAERNLVGASFGFLGRHRAELALHSHVTGVLPRAQHLGVGRAIKLHQRTWAAERDVPWITWTFDPLVRRNAWFNIGVLGATVAEYVVNFYGRMRDSINSGSDSDRLVVAWATQPDGAPAQAADGASVITVPTPDNIVILRRTDPAAADDWRLRLRRELGDRLAGGATVVGFTRDGDYQLVVPA